MQHNALSQQGRTNLTGSRQKSVHTERPMASSDTLRDRVCMTAAMLGLEPIFEAGLPPEQYAYRPGEKNPF